MARPSERCVVTDVPQLKGHGDPVRRTLAGLVSNVSALWINEIHYDNVGTDTGEFIELAGVAGTDLSNWTLVLYNGATGQPYATTPLAGLVLNDAGDGFGLLVLSYPSNGLQNGAPDGLALHDGASVIQFLSYEGSFTALGGVAAGLTSTPLGVAEGPASPVGGSLQLAGAGIGPSDFFWTVTTAQTAGAVNAGQVFMTGIPELSIFSVQGAGHRSPWEGSRLQITGVVTAVDTDGFHVQDPLGDGDITTSDALFVATSARPSVQVGDRVRVTGTVAEFQPGGPGGRALTETRLLLTGVGEGVLILERGQPLPPPVLLGRDGYLIPNRITDDDALSLYEPAQDGIDFWEALEGMRVTVPQAQSVSATTTLGEVWVLAEHGAQASGLGSRGTLLARGGGDDPLAGRLSSTRPGADFNPERVLVNDDRGQLPGFFTPQVDAGTRLGDITGVLTGGSGRYELRPTQPFSVSEAPSFAREVTAFQAEDSRLRMATFNLRNLDPNDADGSADVAEGQFTALAAQIVEGLLAPDIIALQEVQDDDGAANTSVTSAALTLQLLVDAIVSAGGPRYAFLDNPFITDDRNGGEPGGNIRNAFLYNPMRVGFIEGSLATLGGEGQGTQSSHPFFNARPPLLARFAFNGAEITVINNHLTAKSASSPLMGALQPPVNGGEAKRLQQAIALREVVTALHQADPGQRIVVLGDLNEIAEESPLRAFTASDVLHNLLNLVPELERYSFVFEGNATVVDHVLVTPNLLFGAAADIVHVNAEYLERASDHDPMLVSLVLTHAEGSAAADRLYGDASPDTLRGLTGNDTLLGLGGGDNLQGGAGADRLFGGGDADLLIGGAGADRLEGGDGPDRLWGQAGADILVGGGGPDRFIFRAGDSGQIRGHDRILDFNPGPPGQGDAIDYAVALTLASTPALATSDMAAIEPLTGRARFAEGSGNTRGDALLDLARAAQMNGDHAGECALFRIGEAGSWHVFVSDGVGGLTPGDLVVELIGVTEPMNALLRAGNLFLLA